MRPIWRRGNTTRPSALVADWDALRSAPPAEQNRSLAAPLAREKKAEYLEDEAIFCCALSMGLELGRL